MLEFKNQKTTTNSKTFSYMCENKKQKDKRATNELDKL